MAAVRRRVAPVRVPARGGDRSAQARAKRIPELVADDIRRRILRRELGEGDSLPPESELMKQYRISRPTLREALRVLESEGLIVIRRGGIGGALVQRPATEAVAKSFGVLLQYRGATVADVFTARMLLEPPALAQLAGVATRAQLARLRRMLKAAGELIGMPPERYIHAISELHETMIEFSGNVTLTLLVRLLRDMIERHTAEVGHERPGNWPALQRQSLKSHGRLIDLIEAGDADAVQAFWRLHMKNLGRQLLRGWGEKSLVEVLG